MSGINLLLSAICLNSTFCPNQQPSIGLNSFEALPRDNFKTTEAFNAELKIIAAELKGKILNVTTLEDFPLSFVEKDNKTGELVGKGWAFEFFDFLAKKYDFKYKIINPDYNIVGGSNDSDGSLMQLMLKKKADVGVAFIPMLADLLNYMEFSTPLDEGEWKMIMTRPQESASGAGLLAPFDEIVWYLILVSLIVTGPCIFCIIWIYQLFGKSTGEPAYNLWQCCWYVYGGLMKQGSVLSPNADSIRVAFSTWWIFITILTSFYTANLTAFLTLARFSLPINVPKDILDKRQAFISQRGFAIEYAIKNTDEELELLKPMLDKNLAIFTNKNNDTDVLLNMVLKKNLVFIRDKPAIDHLVYEDYRKRKLFSSERLQCPFAMSKEISLRRKRGFVYPQGSKWKKLFDPQLRYFVEAGIVKHLLNYGLPKAEICPQNLQSIERQLRLTDLMTTYLTMLVGFSTAVVVFCGEMIYRYVKNRKLNEIARDRETIRRITVQPSRKLPATFKQESTKMISPPPAYSTAIKTIFNTQNSVIEEKANVESYRTFNGRTYAVVKDDGGTQLIPYRTPSAALFNYAYNSYSK